jgi:putative membrane protein
MKRLTLGLALAGLLAAAPMASAQQQVPGSVQDRNDTTPSGPRPTPSTTRRSTPPFPGDEPMPPQQVPPDVPPAGMPTPSAPSPERVNEPIEAPPPATARPEAADGDVQLLQKVHELNEKELKIAQLAADKARSPRVKSYARTLISDHKASDRQLLSYADKRGLTARMQQVAAAASAAAPAESDMHARLLGETGAEFDHDFVATMVEDHDRAIQVVRTARDSAVDPQLRDMFDGLIPKLEKHRKMAQQLLDKHVKS